MSTIDTDWQGVWLDSVSFYRKVKDAKKNVIGVSLVSGPYPCNYLQTPNYAEPNTAAGQSKQDNIFTANDLRLTITADVHSIDFAKVTDRDGFVEWGNVNGAPRKRQLLGYMSLEVVPTLPPTVI